MKITLLGATGKTGRELLTQALDAGHVVIAVVRTPSKVDNNNPRLHVVKGDVTNVDDLASAIVDSDVLISTLGGMSSSLMTDVSKAVIAAAHKSDLKRVVIMSSFLVERDQLSGMTKILTGLFMRQLIADKSTGEKLLRDSDLDWTIVYATILTNKPKSSGVRIVPRTEKISMKNKIARAAVAAWILDSLKDTKYVKKSVTISQ